MATPPVTADEEAPPTTRGQRIWHFVLTLAIGTVGGALADMLALPLAWMIGAMCFTTVASLMGAPLYMHMGLRGAMVAILGVMLGSAFAPEMAGRLSQWLPTIGALFVYCVLVTLSLMVLFRKIAGYDWVTSFFAASPGGLNEMVLVGQAEGGDDRTISLIHGARVLFVVLIVPFAFTLLSGYEQADRPPVGGALIDLPLEAFAILTACGVVGAFGARALKIPAAMVTGPMFLSAAVHLMGWSDAKPPVELVAIAQLVVGCAIGQRFAGVPAKRVMRTLGVAVWATLVMLAITLVFALALDPLGVASFEAVVLSFAPGGLAEMSLIALALGVDAAFVSTHHIVRIVILVILAPMAFRAVRRRIEARRDALGDRGG